MTQIAPEYWEQRANDLSRTSLDTVRASATAWAATTTTLVGVFGTVAVVKGPDTLGELAGGGRDAVTGLVIGAAAVAFVSVLATAFASRGPTKRYSPLNGLHLKLWTIETTRQARTALIIGQVTAIVAALCVLAAGVTAAVAPGSGAASSNTSYLVRTSGGALQCGVLARAGTKLVLENGSGTVLLSLSSGVAEVTQVASCPG